jgi:hypothetical protein
MGTYRPSEVKSGDLAGAPEVEITPTMIEAGVCVLWESGAVENPNEDADRSLVQKIFVAMAALRESSRL